MTDLCLGIDVGTYSSKGVLCAPDGSIVARHSVDHSLSIPRPGWAEHDADAVWWNDVVEIGRALSSALGPNDRIAAMATSAIGPCVLPVGSDERPLRPGILYGIDARATEEIAELEERFGVAELFGHSGMNLTSQAAGPKIQWIQRHEPAIFRATAKFLTATSYIVLRLTGEAVIDRHTASYFNPFIDVASGEWDLRYAPGLEMHQLPTLRWGSEVAGILLPEAAREIGLTPGIPVLVGTVDAMAEAVGAGVFEIGDMMVMYGTTAFLILVVDRRVQTARVWNAAGVFPGQFVLTAGMSTSGAITEWFRGQFAGDLGDDAFATLTQEAAGSGAGARGLLLLPYFSGERTPISDPGARGAIVGLNLSHTRGDLYRAIIDGCALGVRDNVEALTADWDGHIRRLVAVGGGAASDVWLGAVSSATRRPQEIPRVTIGAAYGDALLAALSQGLCTPGEAAAGWVQPVRTVEPDPHDAEVYDHLFGLYRALYAATRPIIEALGTAGEGASAR